MESPLTRETPQDDVPMVNALGRGVSTRYLVRDCYDTLYARLKRVIDVEGCRIINVTGTPGIGKSVFYLDVFHRLKEGGQYSKIVTASFEDRVELRRKVWTREAGGRESYVPATHDNQQGCIMFLYDGIPSSWPQQQGEIMICFCSPHLHWIRRCRKNAEIYAGLYMNRWTFSELSSCNDVLELNIPSDVLVRRWKYFGGTARYTLGTERAEKTGKDEFDDAIVKISNLESVLRFFDGSHGEDEKVVHRLMHYEDVEDPETVPGLIPGTDFIALKISERLETKLKDERAKLALWLEGNTKSSTFLAWLFESYAHERLKEGIELDLKPLSDPTAPATTEKFLPTLGEYKRFSLDVPLAQALCDAYRVPNAPNMRSIDAYKVQGNTLWLFQMTRNMDHDIDGEGILELLNFLDCLGRYRDGSLRVKLVFLVPSKLVDTFRRQIFKIADVYELDKSEEQLKMEPCDAVPGIAGRKKRKLAGANVSTIGDLLDLKPEDPLLAMVRHSVEEFKHMLKFRRDLSRIMQIPQFVAGLSYDAPITSSS